MSADNDKPKTHEAPAEVVEIKPEPDPAPEPEPDRGYVGPTRAEPDPAHESKAGEPGPDTPGFSPGLGAIPAAEAKRSNPAPGLSTLLPIAEAMGFNAVLIIGVPPGEDGLNRVNVATNLSEPFDMTTVLGAGHAAVLASAIRVAKGE